MPARTLPGLEITGYWDLGADGWKPGMDLNMRLLSAVAGARVTSRASALPASPGALAIYIAPLGHPQENKLAIWDGPSGSEAWVYLTPQPGWHFFVQDEQINVQWTGTSWVQFAAGGAGGGGGGADTGPQIVLTAEQDAGQVIDTTTETLDFGNIVEDSEGIWNAADNTIRIPADAVGRTAVIFCQTKHSADGTGAVETVLERSTDDGSTWDPVASSGIGEEVSGQTTVSAMLTFIGGEWFRFRHTTTSNKTTSGDAQTTFAMSTFGAGQIGRIIRTLSTASVVNPQWNAGDFTGWTVSTDSGTLKIYIPPDKETDHVLHPDGYNYIGLDADTGGPWFMEQKVPVAEGPDSVTVSWDQHTRLVDDMMRLELDYLDAADNVVGQYVGGNRLNSAIQLWERFSDTGAGIPSNTVAVMVRLRTVVTGGSQQLNITNVAVQYTRLGITGTVPGSVYAYLPDLAGNAGKALRVNATGDDVEWGDPDLRIRAGAVDEPAAKDVQFMGDDFTATQTGDTIQISFAGNVAVDGAGGALTGALRKLTITGAGVSLTQPVAGELDIAIPGPGEAVPAATTIEEIDGIDAVRSGLSPDHNGQALVWDNSQNAFVPLPPDVSPVAYGGGVDILWSGDLAGLRNVILTDDVDNLHLYDELHFVLRNANDHADVAISTDGGSTWDTVFYAFSGAGGVSEGTTSNDAFYLGGWDSDVDLQIATGILRFFSQAGAPTMFQMFGSGPGASQERHNWGFSANAGKHNAVIVQRDSAGNFTGGQLYVIGVKKPRQMTSISGRLENGAVLTADQEILFHETAGTRLIQGDIGRIRVDPVATADAAFQIVSRDGTVLETVTVLATESEATITMSATVDVTDTLRVLAPTTPDGSIESVYVSIRGEAIL